MYILCSFRFNDSLKVAARLNLRGTREAVELAKEIRNLEAFVHVSTSYANTNRQCIDEVIYPASGDWRDTLEVIENVDEHTLNVLTPKYLDKLPNTYVFTKQLAEHVVNEQKGKLPIVIMRPSIVISSVREPMVGWIENLNGPVAILIASGKGILHTMYTDPNLISDYMPVDIAIKAFIAAAWARGTKKLEPTDDIHLYNCSSSEIKALTMGQIVELGMEISKKIPLDSLVWHPCGGLTSSKLVNYVKVLLLHLLPALLVDGILKLIGKKPMLTKVQRRIYVANLALEYYVTQQWTFKNVNIVKLRSKIKEEDLKEFFYEMETIDIHEYFMNSCYGGKLYILKEKLEDLPAARIHYRRMELLHKVVMIIFKLSILWFIYNTSFFRDVMNMLYAVFVG
nr:fatty acyl-CoA reductase 1-like [Danaus plexippus plexippus]